MTASIVARDPGTGELGVAVFTAYPSVGMRVLFAEAAVGAVAAQGTPERGCGPRALGLLREGRGAAEVAEALADGPTAATTQLAVLAAGGDMAGFTAAGCVPYVGEDSASTAAARRT